MSVAVIAMLSGLPFASSTSESMRKLSNLALATAGAIAGCAMLVSSPVMHIADRLSDVMRFPPEEVGACANFDTRGPQSRSIAISFTGFIVSTSD